MSALPLAAEAASLIENETKVKKSQISSTKFQINPKFQYSMTETGKGNHLMHEAVIVSAVRTPLGSFNGSLGNIGATQLGAIVIEEAVKRAGIEKSAVNEAIMSIVLPCGYGQNPAKQAVALIVKR